MKKTGLKLLFFYGVTFVIIPLALLVLVDITFRVSIKKFAPELMNTIRTYREQIVDESDPDAARRIGHPFALFVLNYKYNPVAKPYHINSLGYTDDEFSFKKAPEEFRIIALGGSTTVGYKAWPNQLEDYLNSHYKGKTYKKFTVYNMGIESYTSMHSVVTLGMHGIDYKPDLIIVHDGYNDAIPAGVKGFRNDYAHTYKSWHIENIKEYPWILVRLIHRSMLAALAGFYGVEGGSLREIQSGEYIPGIERASAEEISKPGFFDRPTYVFKRNLNSIRVLAQSAGAQMMLLTGPYKNGARNDYDVFNRAIKEFTNDHPDTLLCDLQRLGEPLEPYYVDAIHVNNEGQVVKAQIIGDSLLNSLLK